MGRLVRRSSLIALLTLASCTLATYEREIEALGYGQAPVITAAPSSPVALLALTDGREDREYIAKARTAREWHYGNDQDIAAWVTEGLRRGLAEAGVAVSATPGPGAVVVTGRVVEVLSNLQGNLSGSNRLDAKVVVAFEIQHEGATVERTLEGKNKQWALTEVKPALRSGLELALADLTSQLAAAIADLETKQ